MRLGLAAKLCLLAAVLVLAASGASFLFFENARTAARERELIDLADITDDSGQLLMADLDRLHTDLLRLAASPTTGQLFAPGRSPTPAEVGAARNEAQRLFESRKAYQQCDFVRNDETGTVLAEYARGTAAPDAPLGAGRAVFQDARRVGPGEIALGRSAGPRRADAFAALPVRGAGSEQVSGILLLRFDLSVWAERLNESARVLGFLINDNLEFLAHPVREKILTRANAEGGGALDEAFAQLSATATSGGSGDVLRRDNLKLADLTYVLSNVKIAQPPKPAELAKAIAEVERLDSSLRISSNGGPEQWLCRAANAEKLRTGLQDLQQRLGTKVEWDDPLQCSTFGVTMKVVRPTIASRTGMDWFVVGRAVATEEVERAIQAAHRRNLWLTLALSGAAGLVALGFAHYLTRPLRQMIGYTERVAAGQESESEFSLPQGHAKDEIGTLARAFGGMVEQVRARTRELRESEARIRTILNNAAEGIITIDERGQLESFNLAAERLFGYSAREVKGQHFTKLLQRGAPTDMPTLLGYTVASSAQLSGRFGSESSLMSISRVNGTTREVMARRRAGSNFPAEMSVSEVILGDRLIYTAILRDITERKEAQAASERMTVELERRVADRTNELTQANQALESARDLALEANRAKDAFLAVMSHELRTPLNAIIGYCDYWLQEADEPDAAEMIDDLRKMQISGKHLLTLINDILDLAKIQAGKISLEMGDFAIESLVSDLREWVVPLVRKNNNTLEVDAAGNLGDMHSDRTRVRQVLLNLLSNASKFTSNGTIRLTVRRERLLGRDDVVFQVADSGVGMKPDDLKKLFHESFFQADSSRTRKHEGTGLGLVICHKLSKLMGGDITVDSKLGTGTTFTVRLPAQIGPTLPAGIGAPGETPTMRWQPTTVLVIDDDAAPRALLERVLRREGYAVRSAGAGPDALAVAREHKPSAIVLDGLGPGKDGWNALTVLLKSDPATADLPIIMATIVDEQSRGLSLSGLDLNSKQIDWNKLGVILRPRREG